MSTQSRTLATASALYPLRVAPEASLKQLTAAGHLIVGAAPFLEEQEGPGSDERSDRSRAFPPHIADALYASRYHTTLRDGLWRERAGDFARRSGFAAESIELVSFASDEDAYVLEQVAPRVRGEVSTGIAILHLGELAAEQVGALTSRAAQLTHDAVRFLLEPLGGFRTEEVGDLMDASELPFVVIVAVNEDDASTARDAGLGLLRREPSSVHRALEVAAWQVLLWPDLAVIATSLVDRGAYRLGKRTPSVARSVILDGIVLRFAQRQTLEMLARRVASGGTVNTRSLGPLHAAALRLRARVWWPTISLEPFVEQPAKALSETWMLPALAQDVYEELDALAQQARLNAEERIARLLFFLTAGSVGIAAAALVVQIVTSGNSAAAVAAALAPAIAAATIGWAIYARTFR